MKCINCNTENTYRERTTTGLSRCKKCGHQFVFDYRRHSKCPSKLTDTFFLNAIDRISANNTLYFTAKQFKYFLSIKSSPKNKPQPTVKSIKVFMIEDVNSFLAQKNAIGIYLGLNLLAEVILWTVFKKLTFISIFTNDWKSASFWLIFLISNAIILPLFHSDFLKVSKEHRYHRQHRNKRTVFFSNLTLLMVGTLISRGYFYYIDFLSNLVLSFENKQISFIVTLLLAAPLFLTRKTLTNFSVYLADFKEGKRGTFRVIREIYNYGTSYFTEYFDTWIQEWERINGKIDKLLPPPQDKVEASINSDVRTYSFDRLIVCESADIAQFLIANNFHFEKNCAILSIDGYPQNIFNTVMQMLRRNPNLSVYAVHDCTPKGISIVHQLQTSEQWFRDRDVTIIDIGILPRQILAVKGKGIWIKMTEKSAQQAKQLPLEIQQSLGEDELKWLKEGNFAELASFHPQKLIHILSQSLANQALNFDDLSLRETDDSLLEETDRKNNIRYQYFDTFG
ncbi:hypothetical protein VB834_22060 [Limnoraphis robusta Tam1]|uniref:Topoisomerase 6 subunit A/Spo11 TOPRIM domain-containing protein n=1 Tax=Limnoraphis robusta CCNP1315 TaxID=3110306 RepID=A0ABU5U879_9CYAN|nr:hypothetical protein [Limnoraphis robusta]MEA5523062.1 hypothetical protein [Limnoraphis robusta CCNP1315]MEA5541717.1 hypothetical protein [Limnoraphis robusta Tam1]MEA5548739.1 hypothetical protein [Limnoraphis robusta CCNP1324]